MRLSFAVVTFCRILFAFLGAEAQRLINGMHHVRSLSGVIISIAKIEVIGFHGLIY